MHLGPFILSTCALLTVALPTTEPRNAIDSPALLPKRGVEIRPAAKSLKRQLPDFYMDAMEWFLLADKQEEERKKRERKEREQREQARREQERREQKRREQEREKQIRQGKNLGDSAFVDTVVLPDDYIGTVDLQDFPYLE